MVPTEVPKQPQQRQRHREPLHGIGGVLFRAQACGYQWPVGLIRANAWRDTHFIGKAFAAQLAAFVSAHGITRIAIKKRSKKGEFAGGPTTFKIEGIIQLLDHCDVQLLSPQTLTAQFKKHAFDLPASLNKYQHDAYKTACAALLKA